MDVRQAVRENYGILRSLGHTHEQVVERLVSMLSCSSEDVDFALWMAGIKP